MSGPNPPGPDQGDLPDPESGNQPTDQPTQDVGTDTGFSQAYSAPESEQFSSGPYVPADAALYEYDTSEPATELVEHQPPPRWPWVVGVAAILAAVALVVSVSVLVTRTNTSNLAVPQSTTPSVPPVQEPTTTIPPPPPPPPPTTEVPPPPPPPETVTVTQAPPPPPAPAPTEAPAPPPTTTQAPPAPPPTTTTTRSGPRQVTYSVTGTKAPGDIITVTYVDASGRSRTQRNVYIPWSLTVTPISESEVGSVQASSLFLVSRLNCSITTSDGQVLSSNTNNAAQTSC